VTLLRNMDESPYLKSSLNRNRPQPSSQSAEELSRINSFES